MNPQSLRSYLSQRNVIGFIIFVLILAAIPLGLYLTSKNQSPITKADSSLISLISGTEVGQPSIIDKTKVKLKITLPRSAENDPAFCVVNGVPQDDNQIIYKFNVRYVKNGDEKDPATYKVSFKPDKGGSVDFCGSDNSKVILAADFEEMRYIYADATRVINGPHIPEVKVIDDGETVTCGEVKIEVSDNCSGNQRGSAGCPCYISSVEDSCFKGGTVEVTTEGVCKSGTCLKSGFCE